MHDKVGVSLFAMNGRRQVMRHPDEVAAMLRLHGLGWGTRRIAAELGCDRETVRRDVAAGGGAAYRGPGGRACWLGTGSGLPSGSAVTAATRTWYARSWRAGWASM